MGAKEGTPQGGNLSPLLSNVMLNELDKELIIRGLRFCRYADDCNIYVKSKKAAERVMISITKSKNCLIKPVKYPISNEITIINSTIRLMIKTLFIGNDIIFFLPYLKCTIIKTSFKTFINYFTNTSPGIPTTVFPASTL